MAVSWWIILIWLFMMTCQADERVYVVYMGHLPKRDVPARVQHKSMLHAALGSKRASECLLHSYRRSFNGFVAKLSVEEKQNIESLEGVVSVFLSGRKQLHTTRSWDFVGFPVSAQKSGVESELVIGVLDTGIWPESESFNDEGLGSPPSKWKGICVSSANFSCNNKIIAARYYDIEGDLSPQDIPSPRDSEGHGTHTASTAAGVSVSGANLYGLAAGTARGGVPSARIAVYKICWPSSGCSDANILAAFDDAIADGVDVISLSVGGNFPVDYFNDAIAIGSFHAMAKGILTSTSAGNAGPNPRSITNFSPWFLSVAANTIDRKFLTQVMLGDDHKYQGISINTFTTLEKDTYPLVAGPCNVDVLHINNTIILCSDFEGTPKSAGIITQGDSQRDVAFTFPLPASYLGSTDAAQIYDYINKSSKPTAAIFKSTETNETLAPFVVSFSSRGPNPISRDIMKPDLTAPGVDILAAWSEATTVTGLPEDQRITAYNIISGTSMSCPHASAAAAYVKSFNPTWSPAAIKSALMTTASSMSSEINPDAEFAYGSGQINPLKAKSPGLVYDIGVADYVKFLCGQGLTTSLLRLITGDNNTDCATASNKIMVYDLNYPALSVSGASGNSVSAVFRRTVTNVGSPSSTYKAHVMAPSGINIQVRPKTLTFTSLGQNHTFVVEVNASVTDAVLSASLVWDDGVYQVRSPIVAHANLSANS